MKKLGVAFGLWVVCGSALASASAVPNGLYAGYGDNANVALLLQGHKVYSVAFNIAKAKDIRNTPEWKSIITQKVTDRELQYKGTVVSNSGHKLVVNYNMPGLGACQRTYIMTGGRLEEYSSKSLTGFEPCFATHGAMWSWGADTKRKLIYLGH